MRDGELGWEVGGGKWRVYKVGGDDVIGDATK